MTAITSSAASETDSARNLTPGRSGATALMITSPLPSGRWTSRRTTSGSSSLISGTASATVPASPTTSTAPPSSARTPARKRPWSSTSTTRRFIAAARELAAHPVQLLDVRHGGRERGDERGAVVAERPVRIQPAPQLAFLPARERGDAARLARMPLDERQRLQHRVVDARGDVG